MECTQRLDFECSQVERICPEQIGFLGILGTKYPIKKGPNKVGRDPKSCTIILDLKSISRQHAVINILSGGQYMLMDLDSANKTRLNNKTLQAYVPASMSNGDTVQFGDIFGVFRLLEEETDLPCTQALDLPSTQALDLPTTQAFPGQVPDTPQPLRFASRLQPAIVPESPDVSDKDDSFIMPSQPKTKPSFKSPNNKFVKASSKTIAIQPLGTNKIDNVYWNSSKKSTSFNLDDSNPNGDIHELETQVPYHNESTDSIYTAETQLPANEGSPSIHNLATQLPVTDNLPALQKITEQQEMKVDFFAANKENEHNIHNADTQIPFAKTKDSEEDIFNAQTQIPFDSPPTENANTPENIFTANTQLPFDSPSNSATNIESIFTANTQLPTTEDASDSKNKHASQNNDSSKPTDDKNDIHNANTQIPFEKSSPSRVNTIFTENTQIPPECNESANRCDNIFEANTQMPEPSKELSENHSKHDTSTDKVKNIMNQSDDVIAFKELDEELLLDDFQSQPIIASEPMANIENEEDIPLSQSDTISDDDFMPISQENSEAIAPPKSAKRNLRIESDSSTDCEDIETMATLKIQPLPKNNDELIDCEDVLDAKQGSKHISADKAGENIEDLATQVLVEDVVDGKVKNESNEKTKATDLEDMPTQVITEDNDMDDVPTQVLVEDVQNKETEQQFSEEMISPFKIPSQNLIRIKKKDTPKSSEFLTKNTSSPAVKTDATKESDDKYYAATQEIYDDLCSQENVDSRTINNNLLKNKEPKLNEGSSTASRLNNELSSTKKLIRDRSPGSSDGEDKVNKFISKLSSKQVGEVIGVDVAALKKVPSDPSDVEVTPKKVRPFKFLSTELPDSQEIKTSVSFACKSLYTESSSDSEPEVSVESQDSQDNTPILFHKKKSKAKNVKKELITQFNAQTLPTRIITRTRKPTAKIIESCAETKKQSKNILKSKLLTNVDDDVDTEIISENITRLRNKATRKNKNDTSSTTTKPVDVKVKEEKPEPSKSSNQKTQDTTKNKDTTIDLTKANEEKTERPKRRGRPNKNNTVKTSEPSDTSSNNKKDSKVKTEVITLDDNEAPKVEPKSKKTNTQNKITNYTATFSNPAPSASTSKNESLNSTNETSRSCTRTNETSRSTRSRNKDNNSPSQSIDASTEQEVKRPKRGRPKKEDVAVKIEKEKEKTKKESESKSKDITHDIKKEKETKKESESKDRKRSIDPEEQEVRRSRRQRTKKEDSQSSILPSLKHEQSTVYSVSSESGSESPRRGKRRPRDERDKGTDVPLNKRPRPAAMKSTPALETSRSSRTAQKYHVLFTAFPSEDIKEKLVKLGAVVVSDVLQCTVVLTMCVRRTFKLLCGVGLGRPVVGAPWVYACIESGTLVDPWKYLLEDEASERRFGFSLSATLRGPRGYLRGLRVSATPSVMPSAPEMKLIVECSGGVWCGVTDGTTSPPPPTPGGHGQWVVVSCGLDRHLWSEVREAGAMVVNSEFILSGVLRQYADIQQYIL